MSLESASSSSDTSLLPSTAVGDAKLTIANTGPAIISHQIGGSVNNETNIHNHCTIIHQQNVTYV